MHYLRKVFKIVPFRDIPLENIPYLILRHDIDFSIPAAIKMARIEHELGIQSTYFVLFSSKFYNVLEGNTVEQLRELAKLGHEIGLHYDPRQYRSYGKNMKKTLEIQIKMLEHLLGTKVYSIARHGPWDRDPFAKIKGYINANHPNLRGDLFIHDSCRAWTPLEGLLKLLSQPPQKVQLLIHPENWQEIRLDREGLLDKFFQDLEKEIEKTKKELRNTWLTDSLVLEYEAMLKGESFSKLGYERADICSSKSKLIRKLCRHKNQLEWYFINTQFGWHIHKILNKIR